MKVTREEILILDQFIKMTKLNGPRFLHFLSKNEDRIASEIKAIKKVEKAALEFSSYKEYDDKRIELAEKYADKDKNNNPIVIRNPITQASEYQISEENREKFNKAFENLKKEYKEIIDNREKEVDKYIEEYLKEEIDIDFYNLSFENVPKDISKEDYFIIKKMILDPIEEGNKEK